MNTRKEALRGHLWHDRWRQQRKEHLPSSFYALDLDLVLVSKERGLLAAIEYKPTPEDVITFAEAIVYHDLQERGIPTYIVQGPPAGPFTVYRFRGIVDIKPDPPRVDLRHVASLATWRDWQEWEARLREDAEIDVEITGVITPEITDIPPVISDDAEIDTFLRELAKIPF
jgi:hypothetical protein